MECSYWLLKIWLQICGANITFLLPSITNESIGLWVANGLLVDVKFETEAKLGPEVVSVNNFRVSTNDKIIELSLPTTRGNDLVIKVRFEYQHPLILLVYLPLFSYCHTVTITPAFALQIQSNFKIKRQAFTEVLFPLPFCPLKITCQMGVFLMLDILDLTSQSSCDRDISKNTLSYSY